MHQTKLIQARIYVGNLARLTREQQVAMCKAAIDKLDDAPEFCLKNIYGPHELERFIHDVSPVGNEAPAMIAVLPRLRVLDERPAPGGVGNAFHARLRRLTRAALYIVDAESELRSTDAEAWDDHVDVVAKKISRGNRKLPTTKAREMARLSHAAREKDLVDHWTMQERRPVYEQVLMHWQNVSMNAEAAIAAAPSEAGDLNTASRKTWERIFGGRTAASKTFKKRTRTTT